MSKNSTNPSSRALRRTIALGGLGAFLAVVGGPSCAEIQSSTPSASNPVPKAPSRTAADVSSDDYFDQILSIDSPAAKPDAVKLQPVTARIDIVFEEGWRIFIDGQANLSGKQFVLTPTSIDLPLGTHEVALAKPGFALLRLCQESRSDRVSILSG